MCRCAHYAFPLLLWITLSAQAGESKWIELSTSLDPWKGRTEGWVFADSVTLDAKNPRKLSAQAGKAILVNGPGRAPDPHPEAAVLAACAGPADGVAGDELQPARRRVVPARDVVLGPAVHRARRAQRALQPGAARVRGVDAQRTGRMVTSEEIETAIVHVGEDLGIASRPRATPLRVIGNHSPLVC